jgi:hypothetical protein
MNESKTKRLPRGRVRTQAVRRQPLMAEACVQSKAFHVGFVVDSVALDQGFLRVLRLSPVIITLMPHLHPSPMLYNLISGQRRKTRH